MPATAREVEIPATGTIRLPGRFASVDGGAATVVFAHGSGSSRRSPRNQAVADRLNEVGLSTLLFDLLTDPEAGDRANVFDIGLLAARLSAATEWLRGELGTGLAIGYFGASTGAAAALRAAAEPDADVAAVVSRGGRPDLAAPGLEQVTSPTLLIVGGRDEAVLRVNEQAARRLAGEHRIEIVPGATHLFEEPGALERVAELAAGWFLEHLVGARR